MARHDRWYSSPTQVFWTWKALIEGCEVSRIGVSTKFCGTEIYPLARLNGDAFQ